VIPETVYWLARLMLAALPAHKVAFVVTIVFEPGEPEQAVQEDTATDADVGPPTDMPLLVQVTTTE
jgi:hypothetical protein